MMKLALNATVPSFELIKLLPEPHVVSVPLVLAVAAVDEVTIHADEVAVEVQDVEPTLQSAKPR